MVKTVVFQSNKESSAVAKNKAHLHAASATKVAARKKANGSAPPEMREGEISLADPSRLFANFNFSQYNPSLLVSRKGLDVFDSMRRDDQVKAALAFKKMAVLSTGWEVVNPAGRDEAWEPTLFIREQIENVEGSFRQCLLNILSALDYGFSAAELLFSPITTGEYKGNIGLKAIKTRRPHSIEFAADEHGNLLPDGVRQTGTIKELKMSPEKFLIFVPEYEFGNWYGRSDLEACYMCYSDDTEVLTSVGWKAIADVADDDSIATLTDDGVLEYNRPTRRYQYDYVGSMVHESGKHVDLLVTPNHQMWVRPSSASQRGGDYRFIQASDLPRHVHYKRDALWHGEERSEMVFPELFYTWTTYTKNGPKISTGVLPEIHLPMDEWLWVLGVYIAEGYCGGKNYDVGITQKTGPRLDEIARRVRLCGVHTQVYDKVVRFQSKQIWSYMKKLGLSEDKFIPAEYKNLCPRQLRILLDGLMFGDGRRQGTYGTYRTISKKLADDVQEIAFKAGMAATVMEAKWAYRATADGGRFGSKVLYEVGIHACAVGSTAVNTKRMNRKTVRYSGKVYCLEVPHHRLYVRRNGKAVWCGNSWWLKNNAYRWLGMLMERFGIPPIFAMYDPNRLTQRQITDLIDAVKSIQSATAGALPRSSKDALEMWSPELAGQTGRVFIPAIGMLDQAIARALLMPGLLGVSPDQNFGSMARARVNFDVFIFVAMHLQSLLAEAIQDRIIRPLTDVNFGVEQYPLFRFLPFTDEIRVDLLQQWGQFIGLNVVTAQDSDERHIRTLMRFPGMDGTKREPPMVPTAPSPSDSNGPGDGTPSPSPNPSNAQAQRNIDRAMAEREASQFYAERPASIERIRKTLDTLEDAARKNIVEIITEIRDRNLKFIQKGFNGKVSFISEINDLRGLPRLRAEFVKIMMTTMRQGHASMRAELNKALGRAAKNASDSLSDEATVAAYLVVMANLFIDSFNSYVLEKTKLILAAAIDSGESFDQFVAKLKGIYEPYIGDPSVLRNGEPISPERLDTILRTNITNAFNRGRLVAASDEEDVIQGYEYTATLDERTTHLCRGLDGSIIMKDDPNLGRLTPPLHWNCRSLLVPVLVGEKIDEIRVISKAEAARALEKVKDGFGGDAGVR